MKTVFYLLLFFSVVSAQDECDPFLEDCPIHKEKIDFNDLKLWKSSYYVMGVTFWVRSFLPLILALTLYWKESSYIAPATDLVTYLPLAIIWGMTGRVRPIRNKQWVTWSKWI